MIWIPPVLGAIVAAIAIFWGLADKPFVKVQFMGSELIGGPRYITGLLAGTLAFALFVWMWRVLTRPSVKVLFQRGRFAHPWIEWTALMLVLFLAYLAPKELFTQSTATPPVSVPPALLRATVRVLEVPSDLEPGLLLRPTALFDRGDVRVVLASHVVVSNGSSGEIQIVPTNGLVPSSGVILGGKPLTLVVKPLLEGSYVRMVLSTRMTADRMVLETGSSQSGTLQPLRHDHMRLGELTEMEEHGLGNGRKQLAVLVFEMEPRRLDSVLEPGTNLPGPVIQTATMPNETLSWLLEEQPPLADARSDLNLAPGYPLVAEAVGWADHDGQFNPVMYLARPFPRGGGESYLDGSRRRKPGESIQVDIYRGTNPLAIANRFLGSYEIICQPDTARLRGEFELREKGRLFFNVSSDENIVKLEGRRIRPPDPSGRPSSLIRKARSMANPAFLEEPPQLRFLAWQDEWKTNQTGAARHPDGSAVTNAAESQWLREVHPVGYGWHSQPAPPFLYLWFSHPLFDSTSHGEVTLLDANGNFIPPGAHGSVGSSAEAARHDAGNLGWLRYTLCPGEGTNIPARVTVRLRYTVGSLERTQEVNVAPKTSASMSLEGGGQLNGIGQNVDGKAFVAIAADAGRLQGRRFGALAITKDGRELASSGGGVSGSADGAGVQVADFRFNTPISNVTKFIIGSRPVRTNEWKNVVLQYE